MTRSISFLRPMTGSMSPLRAISVRSRPNAFSAGVLTSPFFSAPPAASSLPDSPGWTIPRWAAKLGSSSFKISWRRLLDVHVETPQNFGGHAVALAQQAQQNVLRADVGVIEIFGLLLRQRQDLLHPRRVGNVADHFLIRTGAHLLLDLHADGFEVQTHFLQDVDGHALAQFDQAEQKVFGAEEIVVKPVGFLPRQRQHLLRARREIAHGFIAHIFNNAMT